jgi:hypothetical protein
MLDAVLALPAATRPVDRKRRPDAGSQRVKGILRIMLRRVMSCVMVRPAVQTGAQSPCSPS